MPYLTPATPMSQARIMANKLPKKAPTPVWMISSPRLFPMGPRKKERYICAQAEHHEREGARTVMPLARRNRHQVGVFFVTLRDYVKLFHHISPRPLFIRDSPGLDSYFCNISPPSLAHAHFQPRYISAKRSAAFSNASIGMRTMPAPTCPTPGRLQATPVSRMGVVPVSTTLRMSMPVGVPRKLR